jgi:hypothetical protein
VELASADDEAAWLKARSLRITASEVASLIGFGYERRAQVIKRKIAERANGPQPYKHLSQMDAGKHLEPAYASWFAADQDMELERCAVLLGRSDDPQVAATPDYIDVNTLAPIEVKVCGWETMSNFRAASLRTDGWPTHLPLPEPARLKVVEPQMNLKVAMADVGSIRGDIRMCTSELLAHTRKAGAYRAPLKFVTQLAVQCYILDVPYGWIVAGIGGTTMVAWCYERDARFEAHWREAARLAYEEVERGAGF